MFILFVSYIICLSTLFGLISYVIKLCFSKWKNREDVTRLILFFVLTIVTMALISYQQSH